MARKSTRLPDAHFLVSSTAPRWFICMCGCGYAAVCLHCVPTAPSGVPTVLCDAEQRRLKIGLYSIEHQQMREH